MYIRLMLLNYEDHKMHLFVPMNALVEGKY